MSYVIVNRANTIPLQAFQVTVQTDQTEVEAIAAFAEQYPAGTEFYVVDEANVTTYKNSVSLTQS